jgi:outer membrane protein OmpA-like peptidoglycan-associated protein/tetratricopeptide (TPR) repeat protein
MEGFLTDSQIHEHTLIMNKIASLVLLFALMVSCGTTAQMKYSSTNKKAVSLFEEALVSPRDNYDMRTGRVDYKPGISLLEKAIARDPNFIEAHQLMAEYQLGMGNMDKAIEHLERSIKINPEYDPSGSSYYMLAQLQHQGGKYEEALNNAKKYMTYGNRNPQYNYKAQLLMASCQFAVESMKNPSKFKPVNLGPAINTQHPEYFPTITVDGKTLLFTRRLPAPGTELGAQEDFFVSHLTDAGRWTMAEPMPKNINTSNNEGAPTLGPDGRTLIFVGCPDITGRNYGEGRQGRGSCDLFITKKVGSRWSDPQNLPGRVNTQHWETQPSLSADGRTMYFIRGVYDRDRNRQQDIYRAYLQDDGTWSEAERLSDVVNTPMREESVFIHPDGKTLYFASEGHPGFGGLDIFMSRMDEQGNWSKPLNLGYPINTRFDENSLMVGPDGEIAFFASDREGGLGGLDLYYFELPEHLRPDRTIYMDGVVFDATNRAPLAGYFELIDLKTGKTVIQSTADKVTGEFLVALPTNRDYALNVSYPGYNFFSKNFTLTNPENNEPYHMSVPLQPILAGAVVRLDNVFFDLDKSDLRPESEIELNKLVDYLKKHPSVKIEIGGHTDTRGDAGANQRLSEARARSVYNFVVSKGIDASRMTYKGYGESQPVVSDAEIAKLASDKEKEDAHQLNRRTEYKIIAK